MSGSVTLNDKEYIPSVILASSSGYSSDYISKLAREEKVLGTQIGRQWFIEPESLKSFLHRVHVEKEIRKEELRKLRIVEQRTFQSSQILLKKKDKPNAAFSAVAFTQAFAVVLCGVFSGTLFWLIQVNSVSMQELSSAASENMSSVASALLPISTEPPAGITTVTSARAVASSGDAMDFLSNTTNQKEVFATLPNFSTTHISMSDATSSVSVPNAITTAPDNSVPINAVKK